MEIPGKQAMVVGGASGMARATAEHARREGRQVAILDLPEVGRRGGREAARAAPSSRATSPTSPATEAALREAVRRARRRALLRQHRRRRHRQRTLAKDGPHPLDAFRRVIDLNLVASFNVARIAAHCMSRTSPTRTASAA